MIKICQKFNNELSAELESVLTKHGTGPKFVLAFISLGISSKKTSTGQQVGLNTFPGKMFLWKQLISDPCCGFTYIEFGSGSRIGTEQIQIFKMRSCLTTKLVRILLLRSVNPGKERCSRCGGRISIEYISQQI